MIQKSISHTYKRSKIEQLKSFCVLVECKNLAQTAKKCHSSVATISLYITSLERELGFKLFIDKKNYELTERGLILIGFAIQGVLGIKNNQNFKLYLENGKFFSKKVCPENKG